MPISPHTATALLAAAAFAAPLLAAATAHAQFRGNKPYYSRDYQTRGPQRGYEGFLFPDYYCSYKRFPNRECTTGKGGKQRCRVVSWRLEQTCQ
jgi:hypothetical protein